jgi:tetratricopeptide (TPR) repeat protein
LKDRTWRASWNRVAGALAPALLLVVSSLPAKSQTTSDLLNPLFQGILARPADFNNALQYAALATGGDVESAISTYEQLLFYNPNLASVRFELGVLYYRLGSYEMARAYFASALKMKDMTPALQQRTEDLIAAIDKKLQPDQFSGYVQSGFRYQTNAALGPTAGTVLAAPQRCSTTLLPRGPTGTGSARSA